MSEIDLTLALQLQAQFEEELRVSLLKQQEEDQKHRNGGTPLVLELHQKKNSGKPLEEPQQGRLPLSLVDPSWELVDPNPDIHVLFLAFNTQFFWGRLAGVEVRWSPRMTLCAGVCSYEGRGGLCSVRLSLPLLKLRPRKDLIETLLHEMIHAYLFVTANNRDRDGHGPEFHKHMYRINSVAGTNITVFHTFHDEVDVYRQHIWQCDGPCRTRKPYFGLLKRSMNRAPGPRDHWWERHRQTCGGTYRKIQEPECAGTAKKGGGAASKKADGCSDIRKFISFTGKSNSFRETSSKPSRDSRDRQNDSSKENTPDRGLETKGESKGQRSLNKSQENQNNVQGFSGSSSGEVSQIRVAGASHSNVHGFGTHPGSHSPARKKPYGGNGKTSGGKSMATKSFGGSGTTGLAVRGGGGSRTVTVKGKTGAHTKTHTRDSRQEETDAVSHVPFQGHGYTLGGGEGKVSKLLSTSASQVPSRSQCLSMSWQSNTSNAQHSDTETLMSSDEDEEGSASCPSVLPAQGNAPRKIQKSLDRYIVTSTPSPPAGKTVRCPVCDTVVPEREINVHLDECASNLSDEDVKEDETRGTLRGRTAFVGREEVDAGGTSNEDTGSGRRLSGANNPDECPEPKLYPCPVCAENCSPATINQHLDSHF